MSIELEHYVTAFELAQADGAAIDLAGFLPAPEHPLHRAVLAELIRIDLEYGWKRGRAKPLEDYQRRFPQVAQDAEAWQQIAFEEYRLRRQAGEDTSPEEYRRRF